MPFQTSIETPAQQKPPEEIKADQLKAVGEAHPSILAGHQIVLDERLADFPGGAEGAGGNAGGPPSIEGEKKSTSMQELVSNCAVQFSPDIDQPTADAIKHSLAEIQAQSISFHADSAVYVFTHEGQRYLATRIDNQISISKDAVMGLKKTDGTGTSEQQVAATDLFSGGKPDPLFNENGAKLHPLLDETNAKPSTLFQ